MTEFSLIWNTSGTPTGDQQVNYTEVHFADWAEILAACSYRNGIAPNILNQLKASQGGANTVAVDTGAAVVDGLAYKNDAVVNVNVPSSSGGTQRRDRIVLRASWSARTVRITRLAGTESGTPVPPSITQTPGVTYDIMICQVLVNAGGIVTVEDEQSMAGGVAYRKGGSSSDWSVAGLNEYVPGRHTIMVGAESIFASAGTTFNTLVNFPRNFVNKPIVTFSVKVNISTAAGAMPVVCLVALNTYGFDLRFARNDGASFSGSEAIEIHWQAVGPID